MLANPVGMSKKFGLLIISKMTIAIGVYCEEVNEVEIAEYPYTAQNMTEERNKIQTLTNKMFMLKNEAIVTGLIVGYTTDLPLEIINMLKKSDKIFCPVRSLRKILVFLCF